MINLDSTKKLQIVLAGAKTTLDAIWSVSYEDAPTAVSGVAGTVGGTVTGVTNGTTTVDMLVAPGAGFVRRILSIQLYNVDTGSITPSLIVNDGGTARTIFKGTRATLENLTYENGAGFQGFSVALAKQ